jgi:hypothetical protein
MNQLALEQKTEVLSSILLLTKDLYQNGELTDSQKGLMETLIGAAIWYLPSSIELYSGYISKRALESIQNDPNNTQLTEEHAFPRKMAGQYLYSLANEEQLTPHGLKELYRNRFGKFNLVLRSENQRLKKFQKNGVFIDEETAYKQAEIELTPFSPEDYLLFKKSRSEN